MGVCQQPKKPGKNKENHFQPTTIHRQFHTTMYYQGRINREKEIENNKIFDSLLKEKEKKLKKKESLGEKKEEEKNFTSNENKEEKKEQLNQEEKKIDDCEIKKETKDGQRKVEIIDNNNTEFKKKNSITSIRRRKFRKLQTTIIAKQTKIFNFESDDEKENEENKENQIKPINFKRKISGKFKRKDKKSFTLIEKNKFGDKLFREELNLKISNQTLIEETEGIPNKKYKVISKIGKGLYGSVFLANNTQLNIMVALKSIDRRIYLLDDSVQETIEILKLLDHPNIIRMHECILSPKFLYIVNDYCSYGELFSNKKKPLNEYQLAFIFFQIFSALVYLHNNNIIHRDIKLENILISDIEIEPKTKVKYFHIKMIDFGGAKVFEKSNLENEIFGSNLYIAPEVLKRKYNEKCDTWSVGVLLHLLLVGRAPFEGGNPSDTLNKIRKGKFNTNDEIFLKSSLEVQDLIKKLLEVKVDKRLSAKEALEHPWFSKFDADLIYKNLNENIIITFINRLIQFKIKNKFQQIVLAFIVHNITEDEEVRNIQKLFRLFNKNNDGWLTKEELYIGLCKYKDEDEINEIIDGIFLMLDSSNSGFIQYEQFLRACIEKEKILNDKHLLYAFNFIDKDGVGKLTIQSIKHSFDGNENNISDAVFENIFKEVPHIKDNEMNYEEFKIMMFDMG